MSVNKVIIGNTIVIDLSQDTVTADDVALGVRFHLPNGEVKEGTLDLTQFLTLDGEQTVTNKTISAADNTLPGVALESKNIQISGTADDGTSFSYTVVVTNNP